MHCYNTYSLPDLVESSRDVHSSHGYYANLMRFVSLLFLHVWYGKENHGSHLLSVSLSHRLLVLLLSLRSLLVLLLLGGRALVLKRATMNQLEPQFLTECQTRFSS
jgi:hypothetical protein